MKQRRLRPSRSGSAAPDVSALTLRLSIGPMLVAHGYNKVFGSGGLDGTTRWFESLGLRPAHIHARMAAATEIGAGTLLTLGVASPLPAAAAVGLMVTAARTDHAGKGFFVFKGGWEYTAVVAAAAISSAILGSGRYSIDGVAGRQRSGVQWGIGAAAVGTLMAVLLLETSYSKDATPGSANEDPVIQAE